MSPNRIFFTSQSSGDKNTGSVVSALIKTFKGFMGKVHHDSHNNPVAAPSLNGNNGEWTGSDDVKELKRAGKKAARDTLIGAISNVVGREAAKGLYSVGAKTVKYTKKKAKRAKTNVKSAARNFHPERVLSTRQKVCVLGADASTYLQSYLTPFNPRVRQCHVPSSPSYPSYKAMGFVRGSGAIGTNGVGFVAIAPTLVNDKGFVYYSTSAYTRFISAQPASEVALPGGNTNCPAWSACTNLPYSSTQLTAGLSKEKIEGRIVSCSLRAMFTGTELNRSGLVYSYVDADGDNTLGNTHLSSVIGDGYDIATLSSKEGTEIGVNAKKYTQIVILPPNNNAYDYTNSNASITRQCFPYATNGETITINGDTVNGAASGLIMMTGVAGQSFYFEAIVHVEYVGAGVTQSLMTYGGADVVGLDVVQDVLAKAQRLAASDAQKTLESCIHDVMANERVKFGSGKRTVDY